ncbi:MAG: hypothetical protein OEV79_10900 [candidate division WOR-3 bacterium]|nr:hypothetical protein [candidate division WOR-3 bacterium]
MLCKRTVVFVTLVCFVVCTHGCYTAREISIQELEEKPEYTIHKIVTKNNEIYEFRDGGQLIDDVIVGYVEDGRFIEIPVEEVKTVYIGKFGVSKTGKQIVVGCLAVAAIGGIVGMIVLISALNDLPESCPFIHSCNGTKYILDGEPYGGAVCQGLQRTDYCRLENLKPVEGEYRILLANELNEIQYTDEFKLLIVDHSKDVTVCQDADGHFYTLGDMRKPLHITDADGHDQYQLLSAEDCLLWTSSLDHREIDASKHLRDTLFINFPRPCQHDKAKLIVSGCNTIWGSHMLRQMVSLFGNQTTTWYEEMMTAQWQQMIEEWNDQVELYQLQVYVREEDGWTHRGEIMGGGPFVSETRVVPLDLTRVEGDSVMIRLMPPSGFWQFNMFSIEYSEDLPIQVQEVSATEATAHDGRDVRDKLESTDAEYYVMPETGQQAYLVFPAPELRPDLKRTIYAKVSGYYDLKIETEEPPQYAEIYRILTEPDYGVTFSNEEYLRIINQHASSQ